MDITTLFDNDSPDLEPYLDRNKAGAIFKGASKDWTIAEVTVDQDWAPNPFNGKMQTRVVLKLG